MFENIWYIIYVAYIILFIGLTTYEKTVCQDIGNGSIANPDKFWSSFTIEGWKTILHKSFLFD